MKLKFDIEKYDRMGGAYTSVVINGKTLRSCLLQAYDTLGLYDTAQDIIHDEVFEIGHRLTDQELQDRMIEQSGDGSDYILSITNLDTGEVIYDSGEKEDFEEIESEYDDEPSFEDEVDERYGEEDVAED